MPSNDTPSWLEGHPLIVRGSWDSTPIFRVRRGVNGPNDAADYARRYSVETVAVLKKLGFNLATVDFMKAFGLAAELPIAEGLRPFIDACKQAGIRIGYYIGSTLGYETMLLEDPASEEWLVRNPGGGFLDYIDGSDVQSFRARVYFPHPGYRAYIKKVLHAAIVDFGADQIHFDSASEMAAEEIFYHPRGTGELRHFLQQRYTPDELKDRLGFVSASAIRPPRADMNPVRDPLVQEWIDFRCQMLVDYFAEMKEYIRGLNAEVVIAVNTVATIAPTTFPNMEFSGVDHSRLLPLVDVLWNEETDCASYPSNVLVSRIRSYKMVCGAGRRMLTYTGDAGKLPLAEAMAYNRECLGMIGDESLTPDLREYVDFYRNNFDCYRAVETVSDVAVLYSYHSMAYDGGLARQSSLLFHQALIQAKVPFDIIFDDRLADLSAYRVLVLPDQECMEEPLLTQIRSYVKQGGGLVATENTSLMNNRRQTQAAFGLADLFGTSTPPDVRTPPLRREVGSGRVVYIASVMAGVGPPDLNYPLPFNWTDLIEAVRWAAHGQLTLEIDAPLYVTTELTRDATGDCYFVHLLNYSPHAPVTAIGVRLRLPQGRGITSIEMLTTAHTGAQALPTTVEQGVAVCVVPILEIYAVVRATLS